MIMNMMVYSEDIKLINRVSLTATLYGAPGETLTLSGPTNKTVTLNSNGIGSATLLSGQYTITGSVSKEALPAGRIATLLETNTTLTAYPKGALFWFGNGDNSSDPLWSKCGGFGYGTQIHPASGTSSYAYTMSFANNTNSVTLTMTKEASTASEGRCGGFYMKNSIATSGFSKMHVVSSGVGSAYAGTSQTNDYGTNGSVSMSSGGSMAIAPYFGTWFYGYESYQSATRTQTLKALWVE